MRGSGKTLRVRFSRGRENFNPNFGIFLTKLHEIFLKFEIVLRKFHKMQIFLENFFTFPMWVKQLLYIKQAMGFAGQSIHNKREIFKFLPRNHQILSYFINKIVSNIANLVQPQKETRIFRGIIWKFVWNVRNFLDFVFYGCHFSEREQNWQSNNRTKFGVNLTS